MDIEKSSRHSKIIGEFGEAFLCNWLSRSGFEVTIVDHTGLDVIAYHKKTGRRLGITVKSRTRNAGKEAEGVTVFVNRKDPDRRSLRAACEAFACEAWVAVYVEAAKCADLYLMSLLPEQVLRDRHVEDGGKAQASVRQGPERPTHLRRVHGDELG